MKFKFNYHENKLWRSEDEYTYEISEESRHLEHFFRRGARVSFQLGANHFLIFNPHDEFSMTMTVYYTKPLTNNTIAYYQKKIIRNWWQVETIIEFSEADRQEIKSE
jgi:hypothetical protein